MTEGCLKLTVLTDHGLNCLVEGVNEVFRIQLPIDSIECRILVDELPYRLAVA